MSDFMENDRMRKLSLAVSSLLGFIFSVAAFADDAQQWYPYPESDTVEEPGWYIFGVIVLVAIVISLGTYYSRKNANKPDDQ